MQTWCPFAVRAPIVGHTAGSGLFTPGVSKIVHHTTEGDSYVGAYLTYKATGDLPHFTDTFEGGIYNVWQHLPLDVAASALKHPPHSGETNRDNAIQIEHVGRAATSAGWLPGYLAGIGRLCRWIEAQTGARPVASARFAVGAPRLDWASWHMSDGHLGHMHVPFNDHVDPGAMDIAAVLATPAPAPAPPSPPPVITPFPGDHMHRVDLTNVTLDPSGNGWVRIPNTQADHVVSIIAQGAYPPDNGYWNLPVFGRQQRGADTIIQISEADLKAVEQITVWVADA